MGFQLKQICTIKYDKVCTTHSIIVSEREGKRWKLEMHVINLCVYIMQLYIYTYCQGNGRGRGTHPITISLLVTNSFGNMTSHNYKLCFMKVPNQILNIPTNANIGIYQFHQPYELVHGSTKLACGTPQFHETCTPSNFMNLPNQFRKPFTLCGLCILKLLGSLFHILCLLVDWFLFVLCLHGSFQPRC